MAKIINFIHTNTNGFGGVQRKSISEDIVLSNEIGMAWKTTDDVVHIIPFAQILEIEMREV